MWYQNINNPALSCNQTKQNKTRKESKGRRLFSDKDSLNFYCTFECQRIQAPSINWLSCNNLYLYCIDLGVLYHYSSVNKLAMK